MIPRLYVDVDGTLVDWGKGDRPINPYEEPWEFNPDVIDYVKGWKADNPEGIVIVWSGGGTDYARMWADRSGLEYAHAMAKQRIQALDTDVFLDDSPAKCWADKALHPRDL